MKWYLETCYSFPNINATNNCVKISIDNGISWKLITIPIGCYEINAINDVLQFLIVVEAGGRAEKIILSPDTNTLNCILDIKDDNYQIDFAVANSLRTVLGFDARIYKRGRYESENFVDIMNGIEVPVISKFFPNAAPGDKIVYTPKNLIYVLNTLNVISHMTCWLTDQNGNELDNYVLHESLLRCIHR